MFVAVYLPPQTDAGTKTALNQLYKAISKQENAHPETALLVAGDIHAGKLNLPNFYQNVQTEGKKLENNFNPHTEMHTKPLIWQI